MRGFHCLIMRVSRLFSVLLALLAPPLNVNGMYESGRALFDSSSEPSLERFSEEPDLELNSDIDDWSRQSSTALHQFSLVETELYKARGDREREMRRLLQAKPYKRPHLMNTMDCPGEDSGQLERHQEERSLLDSVKARLSTFPSLHTLAPFTGVLATFVCRKARKAVGSDPGATLKDSELWTVSARGLLGALKVKAIVEVSERSLDDVGPLLRSRVLAAAEDRSRGTSSSRGGNLPKSSETVMSASELVGEFQKMHLNENTSTDRVRLVRRRNGSCGYRVETEFSATGGQSLGEELVQSLICRSAPLLVSNHVSAVLDAGLMGVLTGWAPSFGSASLRKQLLVGEISQGLGMVLAHRGAGSGVGILKSFVEEHEKLVSKTGFFVHQPLVVYPQGTTLVSSKVSDFKEGAFRCLAPVTPVVLHYRKIRQKLLETLKNGKVGTSSASSEDAESPTAGPDSLFCAIEQAKLLLSQSGSTLASTEYQFVSEAAQRSVMKDYLLELFDPAWLDASETLSLPRLRQRAERAAEAAAKRSKVDESFDDALKGGHKLTKKSEAFFRGLVDGRIVPAVNPGLLQVAGAEVSFRVLEVMSPTKGEKRQAGRRLSGSELQKRLEEERAELRKQWEAREVETESSSPCSLPSDSDRRRAQTLLGCPCRRARRVYEGRKERYIGALLEKKVEIELEKIRGEIEAWNERKAAQSFAERVATEMDNALSDLIQEEEAELRAALGEAERRKYGKKLDLGAHKKEELPCLRGRSFLT